MPATLLLLLAASIATLYLEEDITILDNLRDIYPYIKSLDKAVYMDSRSINVLYYISGYKNNINLKEYPDDLSEIKDAYVVVNREMIRNLKEAYKDQKFPKEIYEPPEGWVIVKEAGNEYNKIILYRV